MASAIVLLFSEGPVSFAHGEDELSGLDYAEMVEGEDAAFARYPSVDGVVPEVTSPGFDRWGEPYEIVDKHCAPDFAGRFCVNSTGCGTQCQVYWVTNPLTRGARHSITSSEGAKYRLDSLLIIENPPSDLRNYGAAALPNWLSPRCHIYDAKTGFQPIDCPFGR